MTDTKTRTYQKKHLENLETLDRHYLNRNKVLKQEQLLKWTACTPFSSEVHCHTNDTRLYFKAQDLHLIKHPNQNVFNLASSADNGKVKELLCNFADTLK